MASSKRRISLSFASNWKKMKNHSTAPVGGLYRLGLKVVHVISVHITLTWWCWMGREAVCQEEEKWILRKLSVPTSDALTSPCHSLASDTTFSHWIKPPGKWLFSPWAVVSSSSSTSKSWWTWLCHYLLMSSKFPWFYFNIEDCNIL